MITSTTTDIGRGGENLACEYLENHGYQILERNWQPRGRGEVDIIARNDDTLVFIEVKVRGPGSLETPQESISPRKIHLLKNMAQLYIKIHPDSPRALRIDFVGISFPEGKNQPKIELFRNITS